MELQEQEEQLEQELEALHDGVLAKNKGDGQGGGEGSPGARVRMGFFYELRCCVLMDHRPPLPHLARSPSRQKHK